MYDNWGEWKLPVDIEEYLEIEYNDFDYNYLHGEYPVATIFLDNFGLEKNMIYNLLTFKKMFRQYKTGVIKCKKIIDDLLESVQNSDKWIEEMIKEWFKKEKADGEMDKYDTWKDYKGTEAYYSELEENEDEYWSMLWEDEYYEPLFDAMKEAKEYEWRDGYELKIKLNKYLENLDNILSDIQDFMNNIKHHMFNAIFEIKD